MDERDLIEIYQYLLLARVFEEKVNMLYREGLGVIEVPHSCIGQEAIGVGACYKLSKDDYVVPSLRTRPAFLVRGVPPKIIMAGIFGKSTGPAKGKVTSHHMGDHKYGIIGTTGVVGAQIPIAVGVALACKLRKKDSVVLCFFGDGASNRGDFHEGLNLAAVKDLPVIFICENNQYAMWTPFKSSFKIENIADRAVAYGFPGVVVDGNDVLAVHKVVQDAVKRAKDNKGPTLIECKTYRIRGHSERLPERRDENEIKKWMEKDPVVLFENRLLKMGIITIQIKEELLKRVVAIVDEAVKFAQNSPFPQAEEALKDVYNTKPTSEPDNNTVLIKLQKDYSSRLLTMGEALNEALREELSRDPNVILIGEDIGQDAIGPLGGLWPPTRGLCNIFPERVIGTPISESAMVGAAVGCALMGIKTIVEIQFADFLTIAMDHIVNTAAKMRYNYGGDASVPIVVRAPFGVTGRWMGMHHSQSPEAWFTNIPGLKIVMPSTPFDAKGLLKSAIRDEDPVIFFEHKLLYNVKGPVPPVDYTIALGRADVKREGKDVTVVATGYMVHKALLAANILSERGINVEVIDPRTLIPLDENTIIESVKKTGKLIIIHEAPKLGGFGGEIAALVAEKALGYLDAPITRLGAPYIPVPFSPPLEQYYIIDEQRIINAILNLEGERGSHGKTACYHAKAS
ncbi:MAG: pyruvate dehydrogenase complex E1 component subunit beta [Candidatus Micrarchaeia archaeon]